MRFNKDASYRLAVWRVLIADFFQRYIHADDAVLDLGCGYGEFINQVASRKRFAMDLNPEAPNRLAADVQCLLQDCSAKWPLENDSLNLVFTSNFFEHLEKELDDCGFLRNAEKRPSMVRNIRNLFQRTGLTHQEIRTLHGIVAELATYRQRRKRG
jgi:SAM-dependent methyltransferase